MFGLGKFKVKESILENKNNTNYEIELNVLFYVVKYGAEINLEVNNNDVYEHGEFLALNRTLNLDGFLVNISQWAKWTISIMLVDKNKSLTVAEMNIPNRNINWNNDECFIKSYSTIKWIEEGSWCEMIYTKINSLKNEIENKRKYKELEIVNKESLEKSNILKQKK